MYRMWNTFIGGTGAMGKVRMMNNNLKLHPRWKNFSTENCVSGRTGRVSTRLAKFLEYVVLPEDRIEEALAVLENALRHDVLARAFGLYNKASSVAQMNLLYREIIKDRCTVIAVDKQIDQIVGVSLNRIYVKPENGEVHALQAFIENNITDEACRDMMEVTNYVESKVDMFRYYNTRCLMEFAWVGVDSRYYGHDIGVNMVKASIELVRRLAKVKRVDDVIGNTVTPEVGFAVLSSNFSREPISRLNFDWLVTISYDEYIYRGRKLSEMIGDVHKTIKLAAMRIV